MGSSDDWESTFNADQGTLTSLSLLCLAMVSGLILYTLPAQCTASYQAHKQQGQLIMYWNFTDCEPNKPFSLKVSGLRCLLE